MAYLARVLKEKLKDSEAREVQRRLDKDHYKLLDDPSRPGKLKVEIKALNDHESRRSRDRGRD